MFFLPLDSAIHVLNIPTLALGQHIDVKPKLPEDELEKAGYEVQVILFYPSVYIEPMNTSLPKIRLTIVVRLSVSLPSLIP